MAHSQTPTRRPDPAQYRTGAEYRWARRQWKRSHGGSLTALLLIATFFGLWSGSAAALWLLIGFAVVAHTIARRG